MSRAAEGEFDAMMDQAFAMHALAGAGRIEQGNRAFFKQSGTDAAEHVVRRLPLQDDVVDSASVKQLPEQQSRRSRADDGYLCPQCWFPPGAPWSDIPARDPQACNGSYII